MKILWLCNVLLPKFATMLNTTPQVSGGWLTGAADAVSKVLSVELHICSPQGISGDWIKKSADGIVFYGYPASSLPPHKYDHRLEMLFKQLLEEVKPDLVHIWGTEFAHSLAMARAFGCPEKTLINVQGLCSYIAEHYMAHMTYKEQNEITLRDTLRLDWMKIQHQHFVSRGKNEREAMLLAGHVIGRTRWDHACVKQMAPNAVYHKCNETLRSSFYRHAGAWNLNTCQKHSIFVSQASYPLKGFHIVLDAMPIILKRFPDAMLYTTGSSPFARKSYAISGYNKVLCKKIKKLGLQDHVVFLGTLSEEKMCQQFLNSHVFVSASSIENSPNSVGEAMLLGVPTVASYVGGTMDLLRDGVEGFLYQADAHYMIADHVCSMFADDAMARSMGQAASAHARITHDLEVNLKALIEIYNEVYKNITSDLKE